MAKLTIQGQGSFDVADDKRLILAIKETGSDILHRCGGHAKCTTCRVEFIDGEPTHMTVSERDKLQEQGNLGAFRLSCQILVDQDMTVEPLMTLSSMDLDDAGSVPTEEITPEAEWVEIPKA
jgi:ferredoxin